MKRMEQTTETIRQRAFARRAVLFSTLALLVLIAALLTYLRFRPALLLSAAENRMDAGQFADAETLLQKLDGDADAEAMLTECRYLSAKSYFDAEQYETAREQFLRLGEYGDSRDMAQMCSYRLAEEVFASGDYAAARDLFYALSGFSDSIAMVDACRYRLAEAAYDRGEAYEALNLFLELADYEDAAARAGVIAVEITGIADTEAALTAAQGLTQEELERRARLTTAREKNPISVLAVGFYHTVGLKKDGAVVATGRNAEGQCDVSGWRDITAVCAGAYHTVGLKKDGTLVATGRNDEGQCDVGAWENVVSVICTDYNTLALLSDGSIVSTGYLPYDMLSGWTDVVSIGGGSYIIAGVRGNGQMVATHLSAQDGTFSDLVVVDASTAYAVGLCLDGTVRHTFLDLSSWKDVVCVEAASTATFGVTMDGRVLCAYFRASDAPDFSDITNAVALAAGGTHVAVLLSDGSVVTRGENADGQCDTGGWDLG